MNYKVTLIRLKSSHQKLRTDKVEGFAAHLPEPTLPFVMTSQPLTNGLVRQVVTTPVVEVTATENGYLEFKTANSTYGLRWEEVNEF